MSLLVRPFFRDNARHVGNDCGRRYKRRAKEGSARVHESLSIHPTLIRSVEMDEYPQDGSPERIAGPPRRQVL